jgi:DedD protein
MRTLLDTEEEEERKPSEITLSTASLLGIFFGLVLVCGVFFGFGYSMGRGAGQARISMPLSPSAEPAETQTAENRTAENTPPPAQAAPQAEEKTPVKASAPAADSADTPSDAASDTRDVPPAPAPRPTLKKPSAVQEAAVESQATLAAAPAPAATPSQPMVQIAAVARREDADVLVAALRQRGYGVVVRNEPQDKFFHVQVGPFADRVQATAIKQKLLSDGYNAIIKQ